ncbi:MAG: TssQ family T6SS-associated lipoprotein [Pseudomonadota bacterium]|nr:TssQ family T6SS-associated lipoprotein [Pseudomonadota bacterium]
MKRPLLIALCAILAACTDTKPAGPAAGVSMTATAPASAPARTATAASGVATPAAPMPLSALDDGIALYDKGDYNGAIRKLAMANVPAAPKATQLAALKYTAFSYCLTNRQTLCRQQFEKALKIDATFDLEPGEKGHPLWGPVFSKVKKNRK